MVAQFLSDAWFEAVESIRAELDDQRTPMEWSAVNVNVVIERLGTAEMYHLAGGAGGIRLTRGCEEGAEATVRMAEPIALALFVRGDGRAAIDAFFDGGLQLDGDISMLIPLEQAVTSPSAGCIEFQGRVAEATALDDADGAVL